MSSPSDKDLVKQELKRIFKNYNKLFPTSDFKRDRDGKLRQKEKRRVSLKGNKSPNSSVIHTIGYYGTKKSWVEEYEIIFKYLTDTYNLNTIIDVFGGSGIISLLSSKLGYFDKIVYNDIFYLLINYHSVLKDDALFNEFIYYVDSYSRGEWEEASKELKLLQKEIRAYDGKVVLRSINAKKAASYYVLKHHEFNKQGGLMKNRKLVSDYIPTLTKTHQLYKNITISNLHYQKVIKEHMYDENTLIFLDPPYVESTRVQGKSYSSELSYEKHRLLLKTLLNTDIKAKIILCGYDNLQYKHKLNASTGWQCIEFNISGGLDIHGEERPKECIWVNFDFSDLLQEKKRPTKTEIKTKMIKDENDREYLFNFKY